MQAKTNSNPSNHHLDLLQPTSNPCLYCSRTFASSQALGGHQNAHRKERIAARKEGHARIKTASQCRGGPPVGFGYGRLGSGSCEVPCGPGCSYNRATTTSHPPAGYCLKPLVCDKLFCPSWEVVYQENGRATPGDNRLEWSSDGRNRIGEKEDAPDFSMEELDLTLRL